MDEFGIIADIFAPLATAAFAFGLTDDAAAIPPRPGFDLVVTTDQIAEGTDFFKHDPPHTIAQKALRVNLSDLAAKGAAPAYYMLSIALPQDMTREWLSAFAHGLKADQERWGLSLIGGDTSRTEGPLSISLTVFGFVPAGQMVRRAGARPGDGVYVTGEIGMSAGGLALFKREYHSLSEDDRDALVARYRVPQPPVAFGPALVGRTSASVDISDGLVADLQHLARASCVGITLDGEKLPIPACLKAWWGEGAVARAATAGDDYQIAFTADPAREKEVLAACGGVTITRIGTVTAGEGVRLLLQGQALTLPKPGYRHF